MSVERRYNKRTSVDFGVKYAYRGQRLLASHAQDISLQGMLLQTETITPPKGMHIQIEFSLGGRLWEIPAIVAHSKPGQMGVMFQDSQPVLCRLATSALAS